MSPFEKNNDKRVQLIKLYIAFEIPSPTQKRNGFPDVLGSAAQTQSNATEHGLVVWLSNSYIRFITIYILDSFGSDQKVSETHETAVFFSLYMEFVN